MEQIVLHDSSVQDDKENMLLQIVLKKLICFFCYVGHRKKKFEGGFGFPRYLLNNTLIVYNRNGVETMKKDSFTILIEKDEDGVYVASVPALKGCHTQAKSIEEIYPRIREAIELYLETNEAYPIEII